MQAERAHILTAQGRTASRKTRSCCKQVPRHPRAQHDCCRDSRRHSPHFRRRRGRASRKSRESSLRAAETSDRQVADMARPWASGSRMDRLLERDVCELVRRVTGLQDQADPNFRLALDFVWSNFRCWVTAVGGRSGGRGCGLLGAAGCCCASVSPKCPCEKRALKTESAVD